MFRKKNWVALIQDSSWVVAKVSRRKRMLKVHKFFEYKNEGRLLAEDNAPMPESAGQDDTSREEGEQLKQRLKKDRIPLKKLKVALSCPGVITRIITLPLLSTKELDKLLTEQVDQYFTMNIEDYLIDYRIMDQFVEDGQKRQRILLAAIPKYQWEKFRKECEDLGFTPKVVDLAADSLARLYSQVGSPSKSDPQSLVPDLAIVDLGRERIEIVLLEHGVFFLYSDLEVNLKGLEDYAEALKSVRSHTIIDESKENSEDVDAINNEIRLNSSELTERGVQSEMEGLLNPVLHALTDFFHFFSSRHYGKSVDKIFLTGYYSNIPLLSDIFKQVLELETQVGFPRGWHPQLNRKSKELQENWMKYGSLYGLALRED